MSVAIEDECLQSIRKAYVSPSSRTNHVLIRELVATDASEIATIATNTSGFTVPSAYVIWMLAEMQKPFCRVAVSDTGCILAYILAMRAPSADSLFLWQLGIRSELRSRSGLIFHQLALDYYSHCNIDSVRRVFFTAPGGARLRLIEKLIREVAGATIALVDSSKPPDCDSALQEDLYTFTLHPHVRS